MKGKAEWSYYKETRVLDEKVDDFFIAKNIGHEFNRDRFYYHSPCNALHVAGNILALCGVQATGGFFITALILTTTQTKSCNRGYVWEEIRCTWGLFCRDCDVGYNLVIRIRLQF